MLCNLLICDRDLTLGLLVRTLNSHQSEENPLAQWRNVSQCVARVIRVLTEAYVHKCVDGLTRFAYAFCQLHVRSHFSLTLSAIKCRLCKSPQVKPAEE